MCMGALNGFIRWVVVVVEEDQGIVVEDKHRQIILDFLTFFIVVTSL